MASFACARPSLRARPGLAPGVNRYRGFCARALPPRRPPPACSSRARRLAVSSSASSQGGGPSSATPAYQTVLEGNGYSIRLYDTHFAIRTMYERRDEGFETLGRYLSGGNDANARLPAPQPVFMTYYPDRSKAMQLYVPAPKSAPLPPLPTVPNVTLEVMSGATYAVRQFTGNATKESANAAKAELLAALRRDGLGVLDEGEFMIAQYGPIFSLSTRVNELMMRLRL